MSKNKFEICNDVVYISHPEWDFTALATIRDDYKDEIQSVTWSKQGAYLYSSKLKVYLHIYIMKKWYGDECYEKMKLEGYVVDHMDNDGHNCCINNLSFLTSDENKAKGMTVDKLSRDKSYLALSLYKDFSTQLYQMILVFNYPALAKINNLKIKSPAVIELAYLLYDREYELVLNDARKVLYDYQIGYYFEPEKLNYASYSIEGCYGHQCPKEKYDEYINGGHGHGTCVMINKAPIPNWHIEDHVQNYSFRGEPIDASVELIRSRKKRKIKTTLLIIAAGISSRFGGGVKQLEPVGMHDEIIMDYSIHDAIEAGFNKIIFVIRKDIETDFRERIGNRIEEICALLQVETLYVFQDLMDIPERYSVPVGREKPWGTGQAVLAAKDLICEPFMVINADDYYGKEAFRKMHDWLIREHADLAVAMVGFILKNTLSEHGGVTRGVCRVADGHTHIIDVVETSNIIQVVNRLTGEVGVEADGVQLDSDAYVSMDMWGFPAMEGTAPAFLAILETEFVNFFRDVVPQNPMKAEYLLPTLIGGLLRSGQCTVKVLETKDKWFGVTYKEDKELVMEKIRKLIAEGIYEEVLYRDLR